MTNLYQIAYNGWLSERGGNDRFPEWKDYADLHTSVHPALPSLSVVLCMGGSSKVTINGDVGEGSIILCTGGGATVEVKGDIGPGVRILAAGGAAKIIHHGAVDPSAQLCATGGGAKVVKGAGDPITVMDIQLVVDPAWVGSISPYRVVRDGKSSRPMDLDEAIDEVKAALMDRGQRRGVQIISEVREGRR